MQKLKKELETALNTVIELRKTILKDTYFDRVLFDIQMDISMAIDSLSEAEER